MRIQSAWLSFLTLALLVHSSGAEERYYVTLFASQGEPNLPRLAHTFAVFTKATGGDDFPKNAKVENHTISWLPAKLDVRPLRLVPEKGKNLDLAATLQWAKSIRAHVVAWGPFEIRKELYDLANRRIAELNGGKLSYIALDNLSRGQGAINCIHAVSDVAPDGGSLNTGTAFGEAATRLVLQRYQQWLLQPQTKHAWVAENLGVAPVAREEIRWASLQDVKEKSN